MATKPFEPLVLIGVTGLALIPSIIGVYLPVLQVILAILLSFVLPGYALSLLILRDQQSFIERILLSLGISIIVDIACGFMINATPWGLCSFSWIISLGGITILAGVIALVKDILFPQASEPGSSLRIPRINWSKVGLYSLAGLIVIGAIWLARTSAAEQQYPGFTQFWMIPEKGQGQMALRLGISNKEGETREYNVQIKINETLVDHWNTISIKPGEQWETIIKLPPQKSGDETVEGFLYLSSKPGEVYRWTKFLRK